jgi:chemotaxis methyl-accepting protein methylase
MLYFRPDVRRYIMDKLCRALAPGGYLVTGEVERAGAAQAAGLLAVAPPAPVFQKRRVKR